MLTTVNVNGKKMIAVVLGEASEIGSTKIYSSALFNMMQCALLDKGSASTTGIYGHELRAYVRLISAFDAEIKDVTKVSRK